MKTHILVPVTALALSAGLAGAAMADTPSQPDPAQAKLSMQQAQAQAASLVQGQIRQAELEHERGGSGLRYSFDIQTAKGPWEVGIDAMTGKVLENGPEQAGQEHEHEAKAENGHADAVSESEDGHGDRLADAENGHDEGETDD